MLNMHPRLLLAASVLYRAQSLWLWSLVQLCVGRTMLDDIPAVVVESLRAFQALNTCC